MSATNVYLLSLMHHFSPGLLFYVYIILRLYREPLAKNPRRPHTTGLIHQLKPQPHLPNLRPQPQNPNPQTSINEQKQEKIIKNNPSFSNYTCETQEDRAMTLRDNSKVSKILQKRTNTKSHDKYQPSLKNLFP